MKVISITQTANRSQCVFAEVENEEAGKIAAKNAITFTTTNPKGFAGIEVNKEYTITIT